MCLVLLNQHLATSPSDVLLLQDPPQVLVSGEDTPIGYDLYLPLQSTNFEATLTRPLVAILVKSTLRVRSIPFCHDRVCGVFVSTAKGLLALISAYISHVGAAGLDALASMATFARRSTPLLLLGADANGHSSWWGPPHTTSNAVGSQVEEFVLAHRLAVVNSWPCPPTFVGDLHRHFSWIDLTLASFPLAPSVSSWRVLPDLALDSDHCLLEYTITIATPHVHETRPAWRRVDWTSFRPALHHALATHCPPSLPLQCPADIDAYATALDTALQDTVARHVPLRRHSRHTSHHWWSPRLSELKSELTRARRRWHRTGLAVDKSLVNACTRTLRKAVAQAKQDS